MPALAIASMQHSQLTQQVRDLVRTELSRRNGGDVELHETILIANGQYSGRRFESAEGYALWFFEEGQIKLYRAGGVLVDRLTLPTQQEYVAKAA